MAKSEPSKFFKMIKTMLAVIIIVAASIGGTLWYYEKSGFGQANAELPESASVDTKAAPLAMPIFTPLEPFTVTLRNEQSHRILYVGITLRMADESSRRIITEYMPEVRDRVLRKLAEQQPDHVQTPEGREALVQTIRTTLQEPYLPLDKGPTITSVLFTAFVVQ